MTIERATVSNKLKTIKTIARDISATYDDSGDNIFNDNYRVIQRLEHFKSIITQLQKELSQ